MERKRPQKFGQMYNMTRREYAGAKEVHAVTCRYLANELRVSRSQSLLPESEPSEHMTVRILEMAASV